MIKHCSFTMTFGSGNQSSVLKSRAHQLENLILIEKHRNGSLSSRCHRIPNIQIRVHGSRALPQGRLGTAGLAEPLPAEKNSLSKIVHPEHLSISGCIWYVFISILLPKPKFQGNPITNRSRQPGGSSTRGARFADRILAAARLKD